jgi:hypothetical protein
MRKFYGEKFKQRGLWIKSDGTEEQVIPGNHSEFLMEEVNKYVGPGALKTIPVPGLGKLLVLPDWKWSQLECNFKATELASKTTFCPVPIGGNALLVTLE